MRVINVNRMKFYSWCAIFVVILIVGAIVLDQGIKAKALAHQYDITSIPGTVINRTCEYNYCSYKVEYIVNGSRYETTLNELCSTLPAQSKVGTNIPVFYTLHPRERTPVPINMLSDTAPATYTKTSGIVIAETLEPRKGCVYTVSFEFSGLKYTRNTVSTNSTTRFNINEKVDVLIYPAEVGTGKVALTSSNRTSFIFGGDPKLKAIMEKEQNDILHLDIHPEYGRLMKRGRGMVIAGAILTTFGCLFILVCMFALVTSIY